MVLFSKIHVFSYKMKPKNKNNAKHGKKTEDFALEIFKIHF